jgi:protein-L-isoaspartate(D-aspartate) O-methyltransferase
LSAAARTNGSHGAGPHRQRLAQHVERVVRAAKGAGHGLRPALYTALIACPRHLFVGRYQLDPRGPVLDATAGDAQLHYDLIYSDVALGHVDASGKPLASTNSPPSTLLHMLDLLDLRPGQRVLEIGSGSGWALGLIAHAVGPSGHAVGVEIMPDLAEQSRRSLNAAGIANATVITGDGAEGFRGDAPYDRVIFTTSLWSLPFAVADQATVGGLLAAPFEIKGPGADLMLLEQTAPGEWRSLQAVPSFFVRGAGGLAGAPPLRSLSEAPLWGTLAGREVLRVPMPLGGLGASTARGRLFGAATVGFRSFLTKTEPRFTVFAAEPDDLAPFRVLGDPAGAIDIMAFGIVDEPRQSLALCWPGELVAYGNPAAASDLVAAYREWADLMMPGAEAFDARLVRTAGAPSPGPRQWVEARGESTFVWSLKPDRVRASEFGRG